MTQAQSQIKLVKVARNHSRLRQKRNTLLDFHSVETTLPQFCNDSIINNKNLEPPQTARLQRIKKTFSGIQNHSRLQPSFINTDSYTQDIFQFISNNQAYRVQEVQIKQKKRNRVPRRRNSNYQVKTSTFVKDQNKRGQQSVQEYFISKSSDFILQENPSQNQSSPPFFKDSLSLNVVNPKKRKNKQQQITLTYSQSKMLLSTDNLLFFGESQNESIKEPNPQQLRSQMTEYSQIQQNILFPSSKMKEAQIQIENYLTNINRCMTRQPFLFNPLQNQSRLVFEVCITNTALNRQYSFWLAGQDSKLLLMTAKKHMSLAQDQYRIMQYLEQENNRAAFAANLSTDFKRKEFVLDDQIVAKSNKKKVYALFNINRIQGSQSSITTYFQQQCKGLLVQNNSNQVLLKRFLKEKTINLSYITSSNLDQKTLDKVMKDNCLIQTKKTVVMKNSQDSIKLYIGKLQSKRYKMIVGSGISPIIAFATLIVLIQT